MNRIESSQKGRFVKALVGLIVGGLSGAVFPVVAVGEFCAARHGCGDAGILVLLVAALVGTIAGAVVGVLCLCARPKDSE